MKKQRTPRFIDTTLRDGEQAPGVVFSLNDKIQICQMLDQIGITEVELGIPAIGKQEIEELRTLNSQGFGFVTSAWSRAILSDIRKAALSGCDGIHISFPVSPILLQSMGKDTNWVLSQLEKIIPVALSHFSFVTVGAQDASRAELPFLLNFIGQVNDLGVHRIRIADTVGILTPFTTQQMFSDIYTIYPDVWLEFHAHNDLSLANANVLSAFRQGVECFSVTINGLGERAGNAAFEEVVMAFEMGEKINCELDTTLFYELSQMTGEIANRPVHLSKPVTGGLALAHESGIHTNAILRNRQSYQLISAQQIGREEIPFIFGKHSGRNSLIHFFRHLNLELSERLINDILKEIKNQASEKKGALSEIEIMDIYNMLLHEKTSDLTSNPVVLMRTTLNEIEENWDKR
ncbi:homocitrate synthase/isopropylmalate synthase family protein [Geofilum sp. OHC36d9]|uniref:homocitrate synthase/isopropylmalate synthase family protein n=1 Tax=Geofilum sp. OHC36d9 TaxID=3458413 RepID=UPI004034492A